VALVDERKSIASWPTLTVSCGSQRLVAKLLHRPRCEAPVLTLEEERFSRAENRRL
jgi:hypothetical protein